MASILKRKDSYFISVSCGYDHNGKQIRRTMTYTPEKNMTEKQIQKEVQRRAVLFEEQVRNGQVSTDGRLKLADYVPMYLETAKQRLSLGDAWHGDEWIFIQADGRAMSRPRRRCGSVSSRSATTSRIENSTPSAILQRHSS